ncbi:F-box At3g52320 isoform X1 [Olea europaea subsp. europaea]|uniref:F-box At3g52320 isoform X1 n=1 Tax=Olea europaea subsp. europaea TaxID=158383 RepID=A0A8S0ULX5_OLEEU|nr:F-box At3g52320 isoform X1 [Olea europaea subsp. europaea]
MATSNNKKQMNESPFLPLEVFFNILLCLPAEFLFNCGRYVCKAWAQIIRDPIFIKSHVLMSKSGLLIQGRLPQNFLFVEIKDDKLQERHLKHNFPGMLLSGCRGLLLFYLPDPCKSAFRVLNPITMQEEILPFPFGTFRGDFRCYIVYISQTEEYKVICLYSKARPLNWDVWTLGIDREWRSFFAPTYDSEDILSSVSVAEVVYVTVKPTNIIAINLVIEKFGFIELSREILTLPYLCVDVKNTLSFLVKQGANACICVLRDLEKQELVKVCEIKDTFRGMDVSSDRFASIGWLENNWFYVFQRRLSGHLRNNRLEVYDQNIGKARA